jgi:hypothetical protein
MTERQMPLLFICIVGWVALNALIRVRRTLPGTPWWQCQGVSQPTCLTLIEPESQIS